MNKNTGSSKKLIVAVVLAAVALVVLFVSGRDKSAKKTNKADKADSELPIATHYEPPPPRLRVYKHEAQAPIIDKVILEKTEMCAGEEFLVTVKAHSVHPEDDIHLHGVIAGKPGMQVPLVARRNRNPHSKQMVAVFGRKGKRAVVDLPPYTIKDCVADRTLQIGYRLRSNTNSHYAFSANIMNLAKKDPFKVESYTWHFGDGTSQTTKNSTIVHDFGQRKQDSLYSNMLVRVEAVSTTGETLIGRRSILMRNAAFSNLVNAGVVTLVVELTPRFPEVKDGVITQGVRLWHHRPKPVEVKFLRARRNSTDANIEPTITPVSIARTLGTSTIPPSGIKFKVYIDTNTDPNLRSIDYLLDGVSAEGIPVKSVFSVMAPPERPTADKHQPVNDPLMTKKIMRARELLGKKFVTDEDIWRLQRQGKFDDIKLGDGEKRPASPKLPPIYSGGTTGPSTNKDPGTSKEPSKKPGTTKEPKK